MATQRDMIIAYLTMGVHMARTQYTSDEPEDMCVERVLDACVDFMETKLEQYPELLENCWLYDVVEPLGRSVALLNDPEEIFPRIIATSL